MCMRCMSDAVRATRRAGQPIRTGQLPQGNPRRATHPHKATRAGTPPTQDNPSRATRPRVSSVQGNPSVVKRHTGMILRRCHDRLHGSQGLGQSHNRPGAGESDSRWSACGARSHRQGGGGGRTCRGQRQAARTVRKRSRSRPRRCKKNALRVALRSPPRRISALPIRSHCSRQAWDSI